MAVGNEMLGESAGVGTESSRNERQARVASMEWLVDEGGLVECLDAAPVLVLLFQGRVVQGALVSELTAFADVEGSFYGGGAEFTVDMPKTTGCADLCVLLYRLHPSLWLLTPGAGDVPMEPGYEEADGGSTCVGII